MFSLHGLCSAAFTLCHREAPLNLLTDWLEICRQNGTPDLVIGTRLLAAFPRASWAKVKDIFREADENAAEKLMRKAKNSGSSRTQSTGTGQSSVDSEPDRGSSVDTRPQSPQRSMEEDVDQWYPAEAGAAALTGNISSEPGVSETLGKRHSSEEESGDEDFQDAESPQSEPSVFPPGTSADPTEFSPSGPEASSVGTTNVDHTKTAAQTTHDFGNVPILQKTDSDKLLKAAGFEPSQPSRPASFGGSFPPQGASNTSTSMFGQLSNLPYSGQYFKGQVNRVEVPPVLPQQVVPAFPLPGYHSGANSAAAVSNQSGMRGVAGPNFAGTEAAAIPRLKPVAGSPRPMSHQPAQRGYELYGEAEMESPPAEQYGTAPDPSKALGKGRFISARIGQYQTSPEQEADVEVALDGLALEYSNQQWRDDTPQRQRTSSAPSQRQAHSTRAAGAIYDQPLDPRQTQGASSQQRERTTSTPAEGLQPNSSVPGMNTPSLVTERRTKFESLSPTPASPNQEPIEQSIDHGVPSTDSRHKPRDSTRDQRQTYGAPVRGSRSAFIQEKLGPQAAPGTAARQNTADVGTTGMTMAQQTNSPTGDLKPIVSKMTLNERPMQPERVVVRPLGTSADDGSSAKPNTTQPKPTPPQPKPPIGPKPDTARNSPTPAKRQAPKTSQPAGTNPKESPAPVRQQRGVPPPQAAGTSVGGNTRLRPTRRAPPPPPRVPQPPTQSASPKTGQRRDREAVPAGKKQEENRGRNSLDRKANASPSRHEAAGGRGQEATAQSPKSEHHRRAGEAGAANRDGKHNAGTKPSDKKSAAGPGDTSRPAAQRRGTAQHQTATASSTQSPKLSQKPISREDSTRRSARGQNEPNADLPSRSAATSDATTPGRTVSGATAKPPEKPTAEGMKKERGGKKRQKKEKKEAAKTDKVSAAQKQRGPDAAAPGVESEVGSRGASARGAAADASSLHSEHSAKDNGDDLWQTVSMKEEDVQESLKYTAETLDDKKKSKVTTFLKKLDPRSKKKKNSKGK